MIEYVSTEAEEVSAAESSKAIRLSKVAENGGPTVWQVTAKNDPSGVIPAATAARSASLL